MNREYTRELIRYKFDKHYEFLLSLSNCYITKPYTRDLSDKYNQITQSMKEKYRNKYINIMSIEKSSIVTDYYKDTIKDLIYTYNKFNNAITRLQKKIKNYYFYKKYEYNYDMNMNTLSNYKEILRMKIIQNNTIYEFYIYDLLKIIKNALFNTEYLYEKPIIAKNPFTNIEFTHTQLYNIFIFCSLNNIHMDYFIQQYYKLDLDIHAFKIEHSEKLFENAIKSYVYYSDDNRIYEEIYDMIDYINTNKLYGHYKRYKLEKIELKSPIFAKTKYKKNIVSICKGMLLPYFFLIYKCKFNTEKYKYYLNKVLRYIHYAHMNNKYFWRVKLIGKRVLQCHPINNRTFGFFTNNAGDYDNSSTDTIVVDLSYNHVIQRDDEQELR